MMYTIIIIIVSLLLLLPPPPPPPCQKYLSNFFFQLINYYFYKIILYRVATRPGNVLEFHLGPGNVPEVTEIREFFTFVSWKFK